MYKILLLTTIVFSLESFGGGLPVSTEVTSNNAGSIGVRIEETESGNSEVQV